MDRTSEYRFTIIVPVFDEEDNIARLEEALSGFLPKCLYKACVLFVDDGSGDRSLEHIKSACGRHPEFHYISFEKNAGLSTALKAGFECADTELVGYMDADLQTDPEDFNLLLEDIDNYSMVTGIRSGRKDSWSKRVQSAIANGFRRMMTRDGADDTGCPLKVLHTDVASKLPLFKGMHRFLPALVLLQDGGSYKQVPVRHYPRTCGKSKYSLRNRLWGPFADCFAYRWMKTRYCNYKVCDTNI